MRAVKVGRTIPEPTGQPYGGAVAQLVEHWWNRSWGTLTRRDVKLWYEDEVWLVEARNGKREYRVAYPGTAGEEPARAQVAALTAEGEWRQIQH